MLRTDYQQRTKGHLVCEGIKRSTEIEICTLKDSKQSTNVQGRAKTCQTEHRKT